jgi:hypothetical protein
MDSLQLIDALVVATHIFVGKRKYFGLRLSFVLHAPRNAAHVALRLGLRAGATVVLHRPRVAVRPGFFVAAVQDSLIWLRLPPYGGPVVSSPVLWVTPGLALVVTMVPLLDMDWSEVLVVTVVTTDHVLLLSAVVLARLDVGRVKPWGRLPCQ